MSSDSLFNIFALSAPHWPSRPNSDENENHLSSQTPFSLQNAIRYAVKQALSGAGNLRSTNWSTANGLHDSVFMSDYLSDTLSWISPKINSMNLIFIGAMSISMRGAIEIATFIKRQKKDVFIVLGGKHALETSYVDDKDELVISSSSAIRLMIDNQISRVFDLVVSGDGEYIINAIIESLLKLRRDRINPSEYANYLLMNETISNQIRQSAKGDWLLLSITEDEKISHLKSYGTRIDQDAMPFPVQLFPVVSNFPVFDCDRTAHIYSYSSKGCIYSCSFCSESSTVTGKVKDLSGASVRLYKQMEIISLQGERQDPPLAMSAFVEDSILLQGKLSELENLATLLEQKPINITFGGQLTVDIALKDSHIDVYKRLSEKGLRYVFLGLESGDETISAAMSKNIGSNSKSNKSGLICASKPSWIERSENVLDRLKNINVLVGFSLLFGLGEKHENRILLLNQVIEWQLKYPNLSCISLNWAVKHPLRGYGAAEYSYMDWAVDSTDPRYLLITQIFGEASTNYGMDGVNMASLEELQEISLLYSKINNII